MGIMGEEVSQSVTASTMSTSEYNFSLGVFGEKHVRMVSFGQIWTDDKQIGFKRTLGFNYGILLLESSFSIV